MTTKITVELEYLPGRVLSTGVQLEGEWMATAEAGGIRCTSFEVDAHDAASSAVKGLLELLATDEAAEEQSA